MPEMLTTTRRRSEITVSNARWPTLLIVFTLIASLVPMSIWAAPPDQDQVGADDLTPQGYLPLVLTASLEAHFDALPTSGTVPLDVQFFNRSTGNVLSSDWDFGDSGTSTETHPAHRYNAAGTYTVSLTVTGAGGSDTLVQTGYITVYAFSGNLRNGSFELGWTDLPPWGTLINQQPAWWTLHWVEPGDPIFGSGDLSGGVPECVHKNNYQLPPNEQRGGPDALVLDGEWTYKIFHANQPFGAELIQVVTGLTPGMGGRLIVPILVDVHDRELDVWGAESGVWVDGHGQWVNWGVMGHRNWYYHTVDFVVPGSGEVTVLIRVKSKWPLPKDFFIDYIRLQLTPAIRAE